MRPRLRQWNLKFVIAFFAAIAALVAQDPTSYLTPDVTRVGGKLACRCGGCRNTVANCPMLHCSSADPMRRRIHEMKARGMPDDDVVNTIVREEGIVALSSPPAEGFGLITWIMPPIVLLMGFFVYSWYVRRNRQQPEPLSPVDEAVIERFRTQIDRELGDSPVQDGADKPK
ncbi:MAG: cytochrome c-type biogenesis protein [Bryobacteraceae bacterium]